MKSLQCLCGEFGTINKIIYSKTELEHRYLVLKEKCEFWLASRFSLNHKSQNIDVDL